MSIESAAAFYRRVESDVELQEKLKKLDTKETVSQYVKGELGYEFTMEEMQKVIFDRIPEMTDEELEAVLGGSLVAGSVLGISFGGELPLSGAIARAAAAGA